MKKLAEIYKCKGSDTAIYLGSGSSINNITEEEWGIISKYDTWTVNNWVYHPFVPKFFHPEVKKYNKDIWKKRKLERGADYKDTNFIINKQRSAILLDIIGKHGHIYGYKMHKINVVKKSIIPKYTPSDNPNVLVCNLNTSFTMLLDCFVDLNIKK